jgi:hypothetical protein
VDRDDASLPRLLNYNPQTKNWAWIDRAAVGPA